MNAFGGMKNVFLPYRPILTKNKNIVKYQKIKFLKRKEKQVLSQKLDVNSLDDFWKAGFKDGGLTIVTLMCI